MEIHNAGFRHRHDADFFIDRPDGSGDYLFLLLHSGSIFTLGGKDVFVRPDTIFLFEKGAPQYYRNDGGAFSNDWVHFDLAPEELSLPAQLGLPFQTPLSVRSTGQLSYLIQCIAYEFYSCNTNRIANANAYLHLLLQKTADDLHRQPEQSSPQNYEMMCSVRNKIYARPFEKRTVDSSAHEVRMSKSNFQHLYRLYFGVPYMEDCIHARIAFAKVQLSTTDKPVYVIAEICGYASTAHFIRQFTKETGVSPGAYRLSCEQPQTP